MSDEIRSETADDRYWYNTKTDEVEHGRIAPAAYRIGPFDTAEEAARAYETLAERSKAWEEDERRRDAWED
ncbi:MAG: SPOR domain-containing protein [Microbacterium sp.]